MSKVITLLENELNRSRFLNEFGLEPHSPHLCRLLTESERRIFRYEVFGLFSMDQKIQDLITQKDGIVIIITNMNEHTMNRIRQIINANSNTLLLVVYENMQVNINMVEKSFLELFTAPNRKFAYAQNQFGDGKKWFYHQIQQKLNSVPKDKSKLSYTSGHAYGSTSTSTSSSTALSSRTMNINDMVSQFENETLPLSVWDHFGRLRIVNYYLVTDGYCKTIDINSPLCVFWKKYKTSVGHEKLWNYTLTRFWIDVLYSLHKKEPELTFEQIYNKYTDIQFGTFYKKYYSDDVLFSQLAKNTWIKPNLIV